MTTPKREATTVTITATVAGVTTRHHIHHSDSPTRWTTDDVQNLIHYMCSLLRPNGARYVYAFPPVDATHVAVLVTVEGDAALTEPLPLAPAVVTGIVARSLATPAPGSTSTN